MNEVWIVTRNDGNVIEYVCESYELAEKMSKAYEKRCGWYCNVRSYDIRKGSK